MCIRDSTHTHTHMYINLQLKQNIDKRNGNLFCVYLCGNFNCYLSVDKDAIYSSTVSVAGRPLIFRKHYK